MKTEFNKMRCFYLECQGINEFTYNTYGYNY